MALPVNAQSMLRSLKEYQNSLPAPSSQSSSGTSSSSSSSGQDVTPSSETISSSSAKCEENDQTSLPLSYVTSLITKKDGAIDYIHDPRTGTLKITSPSMIGNCSSMLEWKLKKPEIKGQKAYAVEVKFKSNSDCSAEGCDYKVAKMNKGEFVGFETMKFKPTLKGFEQCLEKAGVLSEGKVVSGAIYNSPVNEKFSGLDYSGQFLFLSHGPISSQSEAQYGSFEHVVACDHYETAHPHIKNLLTQADAEKARLDAEAQKLADECREDNYHKLADFIEKYEDYASQFGAIRDNLILSAAKKSAEAITAGKYTEEDLKVLSDFERYVVKPKIDQAVALYEEMLELEGDAKKAKQEELKGLLAEISSLNRAPYFLSAHTQKLLADGKFEEAEKLNGFKLLLDNYQRLGAKQDNTVITPEVAAQRVFSAKRAFAQNLLKEQEKYEIRTGQVTGNAQYYSNLSQRMKNNIQVRTQNFMSEIQAEYGRMQPGGYCYKYFRNTQKCIQDSQERIQELTALLQHYNNIDTERASEYETKATEYAELEAQGRRYVAAQNGEEVAEEGPATAPAPDTTVPTPRADTNPGVYTFDFQSGAPQQGHQQMYQQQAQMTPQQYQYPVNSYQNQNMFMQQQNPYQYQQQQYNPWLGQQSYGMQSQFGMQGQGMYSFNYNGGMGQQQMYQQPNPYMNQQQQGYWQQPHQAYNNYSMYGYR